MISYYMNHNKRGLEIGCFFKETLILQNAPLCPHCNSSMKILAKFDLRELCNFYRSDLLLYQCVDVGEGCELDVTIIFEDSDVLEPESVIPVFVTPEDESESTQDIPDETVGKLLSPKIFGYFVHRDDSEYIPKNDQGEVMSLLLQFGEFPADFNFGSYDLILFFDKKSPKCIVSTWF